MSDIFIVDDDTDILFSLERFFTKKKYGVRTFSDGHFLMDEIRKDKPKLVVLDVNLSDEDGRYICREIKTLCNYRIKVLLVSADPLVLLTYEYNYADGIINKPFLLADLERKCDNLLQRKRTWLD